MISGVHHPATPGSIDFKKFGLVFEHLAYAVCGIGYAAGNA